MKQTTKKCIKNGLAVGAILGLVVGSWTLGVVIGRRLVGA